jgi:hypothetical protein
VNAVSFFLVEGFMKVDKEAVVALFEELGSKSAGQWADKRLLQKIESLPKLIGEDHEWEDKANKKLAGKLLKAVENEDEIELVGGEAEEEAPAPKKSSKKPAKAAAVEAEDEEDEDEEEEEEDDSDEEDEDEDDEEEDEDEPAPAKKKGAKAKDTDERVPVKPAKKGATKGKIQKAGGEGSPGVIGSIVEFLSAADAKKPITKKELVDKLAKRFPDREATSMMRTINVQVPNRLKTDKKLNVVKSDKGGYYIEKK